MRFPIYPFVPNTPCLYFLKTSKNLRFSGVFRQRKGALVTWVKDFFSKCNQIQKKLVKVKSQKRKKNVFVKINLIIFILQSDQVLLLSSRTLSDWNPRRFIVDSQNLMFFTRCYIEFKRCFAKRNHYTLYTWDSIIFLGTI